MAEKGWKHLTFNDRLKIEALLKEKTSVKRIAANIGVAETTIYRELKRGRYMRLDKDTWKEKEQYSPDIAEENYQKRMSEKGRRELKIGRDYAFVRFVEEMIGEKKYSPAAALACIEREGMEFATKICLSTLYNYIRGGVFLGLTLEELPYRTKKQKRRKKKVQKRAVKGTSIEKRPEHIHAREEFGHWEMDTVVGPQGKSKESLLVLTERKTLKEIIMPLRNHTSSEVVLALNKIERKLGEKRFRQMFKTITVDNGPEFSDCEGLERSRRNKKKRTALYYCHPYCSCERASNENQNRLIRRHVPKGTSFDGASRSRIQDIEDWMNNYPRKKFAWQTANELFEAELRRAAM